MVKPSIHTSEVFPDSYNVYRKDRKDGYGGVFLACHSKLPSKIIPLDTESEVMACCIELSNTQNIILYSIYKPPSSSYAYLQQLCNYLQ